MQTAQVDKGMGEQGASRRVGGVGMTSARPTPSLCRRNPGVTD